MRASAADVAGHNYRFLPIWLLRDQYRSLDRIREVRAPLLILHGDQEGVVVIPAKMAEEVAKEAEAQTVFEDWVEAKVKEGRSIFGLYPPNAETKARYEAEKGRG